MSTDKIDVRKIERCKIHLLVRLGRDANANIAVSRVHVKGKGILASLTMVAVGA